MMHLLTATLAVLTMLTGCHARQGNQSDKQKDEGEMKYRHITLDDRIHDVMRHPAFGDFGPLLFTWHDHSSRGYPKGATMREMPDYDLWLTNADAQAQVDGLNRLIDDASEGKRIWYDIYTDAEKRADPQKRYTGLAFMRGRAGAPFMLFLPGGGYFFVGMQHEGLPIGMEVNRRGYNVFVLRYRVDGGGDYPLDYQRVAGEDLIRAVRFIREHADELQVAADDYCLAGGSAGAHTVSDVTYGEAGFTRSADVHPAATVIAYTYFSDDISFKPDDSPAFFIVGKRDRIVPWQWVKARVDRMKADGCTVEAHILDHMPHGFSLGKGTEAEGWIDKAVDFWERNMKQYKKTW